MKVVSIKIHNILGLEEFELLPKSVNRFEGKNAVGKTSALEAIKGALKGGHDATLLRNGAEEGQIVILLDDGMEIKKTITADKSDLSVKYPRSGIKVDKAQTQLNALVDALSINPVEFLSAPAKDRAKYLLQAMPLKVTTIDLRGAGVIGPNDVPSFDTMSVHAFEALTAIEKAIFDERTGVNRLKDEKLKTAKQLEETLPLEEPGQERPDWQAVTREATQALSDKRTELKNHQASAEQAYQTSMKEAENESNAKRADVEAKYQEKLRELSEWRAKEISQIASVATEKTGSAANQKARALQEANSRLSGEIEALAAKVADAEANVKRQIKDNATRDTIARVLAEAEAHEQESLALTARLEALAELRLKILQNLPIPGVTVQDVQVMQNGVVYDRLNTAEQIKIAVAIAKLRAKELGIVCVDGLECLDAENFAEFERQMSETNLQTSITRVTNPVDGGMEVITK